MSTLHFIRLWTCAPRGPEMWLMPHQYEDGCLFFFIIFQWCRYPHLGCFLVTTKIFQNFVLFLLPWQWVRRELVWASGYENEERFWEFVVLFCGFGCACAVCCYCLQYFITELKLCLVLMKQFSIYELHSVIWLFRSESDEFYFLNK